MPDMPGRTVVIPDAVPGDARQPAGSAGRLDRRVLWIAASAGVIACLWFLFLSWRLLALPHTAIALDVDHIFDSDPGTRIRIILGLPQPPRRGSDPSAAAQTALEGTEERSAFRIPRHPFAGHAWPLLGRPVHRLTSAWYQEPTAQIHAARIVTALVGGFGVACLVVLMAVRRVPWFIAILATAVYLGFSSQAIVALPELIAVAVAPLALTLLVHCLAVRPSIKLAAFAVLAVALAVTTITLALFPLLCILWLHPAIAHFRPVTAARRHWRVLAVGLLTAMVLTVFASEQLQSLFWRAGGWQRVGLAREDVRWMTTSRLTDPFVGLNYLVLSWVYPAVAPYPKVIRRQEGKSHSFLALSYEPWRVSSYGWANGVGAAAWVLLLISAFRHACRDPAQLPTLRLLGAWIGFNTAMHLVWGREVFLYTPHWSWAVFAIMVGGLSRMRPATVAVLSAAVIVGQQATLWSMIRGVQAIAASL